MKALILAGGKGSRLGSISKSIPKPLVEIAGKPIYLHVIDTLMEHGINSFILAVGHKKELFLKHLKSGLDYNFDITFNGNGRMVARKKGRYDDIEVRLIDTGSEAQTGSRICKIFNIMEEEEMIVTYGDSVGNVQINELISSHSNCNASATVTTVRQPGRFGGLTMESSGMVEKFSEKDSSMNSLINAGYMIITKQFCRKYLTDRDDCILEEDGLKHAAIQSDLNAYYHDDFWQCMDTPRDMEILEKYFSNIMKNGEIQWK